MLSLQLKSFHNELLTQLEQKVELDSRYLSVSSPARSSLPSERSLGAPHPVVPPTFLPIETSWGPRVNLTAWLACAHLGAAGQDGGGRTPLPGSHTSSLSPVVTTESLELLTFPSLTFVSGSRGRALMAAVPAACRLR